MATVCILVGSALLAGVAHPQTVRSLALQVGADQLVSTSLPVRPLVEPHLAANPTNPRHLVGGAIMSVRDEADVSQMRRRPDDLRRCAHVGDARIQLDRLQRSVGRHSGRWNGDFRCRRDSGQGRT